MDVISKDVFFPKDVFFLERRLIKPPFVNFENHAGNARVQMKGKRTNFIQKTNSLQRTFFEKSCLGSYEALRF
jgi:hypothetical protein